MQYLTVPGPTGELGVVDYGGDGRPVLLLHGGASTAVTWAPLAARIVSHLRVYALDFRGHGRSSPAEDFSVSLGADDVAATVDGLGLERPLLVGSSLGGMVAVAYAARQPAGAARPRAVVNIDGFGAGHPAQFPGISADRLNAALDHWAAESIGSFGSSTDHGDRSWVDSQVQAARPDVEAFGLAWEAVAGLIRAGFRPVGDRFQRQPGNALNQAMYRSLRGYDMRPHYRAVSCPTLVLRAELRIPPDSAPEDAALLAAYQQGLTAELAQLQRENDLVAVENIPAPHLAHLEWTSPLATKLVSFDAVAGRDE